MTSVRAALYDGVMWLAERSPIRRWRERTVAGLCGSVLEVGAGTGLGLAHYAAGVSVTALDRDVSMLERARSRAAGARATVWLVAADAEALPFRDAAFDAGVIQLALCTIPDPERALHEMRRVLQPRAPLRLLEHVRAEHHPWLGRLQQWLTPGWRKVAHGCHLDRRAADAVRGARFDILGVREHAAGIVQEIEARAPAGRGGGWRG